MIFRDLQISQYLRKDRGLELIVQPQMTGVHEKGTRSSPTVLLARGKRSFRMSRSPIQRKTFAWTTSFLALFLFSLAASGQITSSTSSVNFGSVQVGNMSSVPITVSNSSKSNLTISQVIVIGSGFSFSGPNLPAMLAPQQSMNLYVTFYPQVSGLASGSMTVTTSSAIGNSAKQRSSNVIYSLSGTGATPGYLTPVPSRLSFGNVTLGSTQLQYPTLTNSGGSSVLISQAALSGAGFSLSGFTAPTTLAAGQSLTLTLAFTPTTSGTDSGMLNFSSNASDPNVSVPLSGAGSAPGQLSVSPGSLGFGTVSVGTSSNQNGVLSATGSSVTISSVTSNTSQFTVGGLSLPLTLAAGQSVAFTVTFSPLVSGAVSGSLSFISNASDSLLSGTLSGTGQIVQHTVSLSWSPSTSSVVGYNVYRRGTAGGPYARINSSTDAVTSYTDTTVQSGQVYYYVTTAVSSTGVESGYSNEIQAQIPTP